MLRLKCLPIITAGWTDLNDPEYGATLRPYIEKSTLIVIKQAPVIPLTGYSHE